MPCRLPILVILLLAALAGAAHAAPVPNAGLRVGIADQKPDMFEDARFAELGIGHARLIIPWDGMTRDWQVAEIDSWMAGAEQAGVEPLVTFGRSRVNRRSLPTPERLQEEFLRFRARYPQVKQFATWNEANHCGEPTCNRPQLVAAYFRALRRVCRDCTILGADLLDMPNVRAWTLSFRRKLGYTPGYFGLHNYVEANRFTTKRLEAVLSVTGQAKLWLTETGGLVRRRNRSTTDIPEGPRHAGNVTRFIFDRIVPRFPRITRVYLYHWNAVSSQATWDSGLITPGGRNRPSLEVLARVVQRGLRPAYRSR